MDAKFGYVAYEFLFDRDLEPDFKGSTILKYAPVLQRGMGAESTRIEGYAETTVPLYSLDDFRSHFRLHRHTFEFMLPLLANTGEIPLSHDHGGQERIPLEKNFMVLLWTLGNQESFRSMADRFNITKSSISRVLKRTSRAVSTLKGQFIVWPRGVSEEASDKQGTIPNTIGAIDGCHIAIKAPEFYPNNYINRKKFYSVILQGVCDMNMKFIDIFAGWPGSVHDARVLRNSPLFENTERDHEFYFPGDTHVLGDNYPIKNWLLTPYRDNGHLSSKQQKYNKVLSSQRQVIERTFALLKGRFRRLKFLDCKIDDCPMYIMASCILHNICLMTEDDIESFREHEIVEINAFQHFGIESEAGNLKRDHICNAL